MRRDGFQRASVDLARTHGAVCGKVGDHGVVFLVVSARSSARTESRIEQVAAEASRLARRKFGLRVHFGASSTLPSASLCARYDQALRAADRALSEGSPFVRAEAAGRPTLSPLHMLRRALGNVPADHLETLGARFERYIEAVGVHCGYRLESASTHLEAGFDQVAEPLLSSGARLIILVSPSTNTFSRVTDSAAW